MSVSAVLCDIPALGVLTVMWWIMNNLYRAQRKTREDVEKTGRFRVDFNSLPLIPISIFQPINAFSGRFTSNGVAVDKFGPGALDVTDLKPYKYLQQRLHDPFSHLLCEIWNVTDNVRTGSVQTAKTTRPTVHKICSSTPLFISHFLSVSGL